MQAIQISQPEKYQIVELPTPEPRENEIQIKVASAGLCGTDLHIFHGEYEATYPIVPGHEFSGTVVKVGSGVKYFSHGDRVTADPNIPCRRCLPCKQGFVNQCENLEAIGVTRNGAFAEYVVVPEEVVFAIGEMPFKQAAMIEPLACVTWGLKRVKVQPGDSALVFGAGPMGCLVAQALRSAGASQVVITDIVAWRLSIAKKLGSSETVLGPDVEGWVKAAYPSGFQIVVDASGIGKVLESAFRFVAPRGKVWVFGVVPPAERVNFVPYDVFRKDITIIGSFAVSQTFKEAIALLEGGTIQVNDLISHQLPLDRFGEALDIAENDPRRMKVQISIP